MIERFSGEYIDEPSIKVGFDPSIGYLADRTKIYRIIQGWDEQYHIDIEELKEEIAELKEEIAELKEIKAESSRPLFWLERTTP
tara:strand:- start:6 stop:257 length:252 start_codon:yes stop_codon:yes gene_type:complete